MKSSENGSWARGRKMGKNLDRDCDHRHPCGYAPACLEQGEVKGADNKLHKQPEAIKHGIRDVLQ